eukprot:1493267-Prymnesium_polylepis.1
MALRQLGSNAPFPPWVRSVAPRCALCRPCCPLPALLTRHMRTRASRTDCLAASEGHTLRVRVDRSSIRIVAQL